MQSSHDFSKVRIIKNVFVICAGCLLLFTAYDGLTMLQSTMNREQGIGVASQAIVYAGFAISAILLPNYVLKKLGSKLTYVISMCMYIPYIASNFYSHWSVVIPTSILIGLGAALLWGAQVTYLNDVSVLYAELDQKENTKRNSVYSAGQDITHAADCSDKTSVNNQDKSIASSKVSLYDTFLQNGSTDEVKSSTKSTPNILPIVQSKSLTEDFKQPSVSDKSISLDRTRAIESTTARFFGIHGMSYLTSHLWSNLMTFFVLKNNVASERNNSLQCICGVDYCNVASKCFENNIQTPSDSARYTLTAICVGIGILGIILVAVFLDPLEKEKDVHLSLEHLLATFRIAKRSEALLLLPCSFYIGMVQGFYTSDFNKAYIGCAWGAYHVGLVAICYGTFCGLSSISAGWLVKKLGRVPIFTAANTINLAAIGFLFFWTPKPQRPFMFFIAAGMWGVFVGVFWSQVRALFGILFKRDEEAAFATFHLWYSLGFCLSFAYSNYLCTSVKLYILLVFCVSGYVGYMIVERIYSKRKSFT